MIKVDRHTVIQILGGLMARPDYLADTDKYCLEPSNFPNVLDRYIFACINNLYNCGDGANKIRSVDIEEALKVNATAYAMFEKENGRIFLQDCEANGEPENFDYYYKKLKKINLIIDLDKMGYNTEQFYSENLLDLNANENFEKLTTDDILNKIKLETANLENKYAFNNKISEGKPIDGILDLVLSLREAPEIGCRLQGDIYNTILRGGRKGKMYIRSAGSGVGKTRRMVGDACYIAYPVRFDNDTNQWVSTGSCEKVLYIMTEQDTEEINTMILSYLTGINEEKLIYGTYTDEELDRYKIAIDIMKRYEENFYYVRIPDPCASVVKNVCRRYNIQHGVENIFYDYIFSSPAMLNEYRDLKLPEFVCLRLFATAIKNLAVELNAFIMTSTQISNDDDKTGGFRDYHCIQGAKQIVNLADAAGIVSRPTKEELTQLGSILETIGVVPNCVHDIFKNRRGRWTCVRVWSYVDLGTLRTTDLFITTANMKPIEDFQIMDYKMEQDFSDVCEFYNGGPCKVPVMATAEEVKEEPKPPKQIEMVDFTEVPLSDLRPEELVHAFNEREKIDIDLENAKLEDLI